MDRLDAMKVFVVAVDEGSLAAAGRKLGRSPAAVSRPLPSSKSERDSSYLRMLHHLGDHAHPSSDCAVSLERLNIPSTKLAAHVT
jgi:hypothetical protein